MTKDAKPAAGWGHGGSGRAQMLRRRFPTIADLRARARRRVPAFGFDFVDGGEGCETGLTRNRQALDAIEIVPRYSRDISTVATEVDLFGRTYAAPFGVAPMGMACLAWPGLEIELARAAQAARLPFVLACVAGAAIERIAPVAQDSFWFQLYRMPRNDHAAEFDLIRRAEAAGAHTLTLTVDAPVRSKRPRDLRNGMKVPFRPSPRTIYEVLASPAWALSLLKNGVPRFENFIPYCGPNPTGDALAGFAQHDVSGAFSWEEIARIRDRWPRGLIIKGILHPEDAAAALKAGADGIYVSNHGGRQLEGAPASIDVLPAIVGAVGGKATILFDSGVRTGLDVVRALALGAKAAFTGRPFVYGVAAVGPDGARHVADLIVEEIRLAMGQLGARNWDEVRALTRRHPGALIF